MFAAARSRSCQLLTSSHRVVAETIKLPKLFGGWRSYNSLLCPSLSRLPSSSSMPLLDFNSSVAQNSIFSTNTQQVRFRSNRSRRGLYNGKDIRSGNSLSFSMKANKRKFKPNVFKKRVYSEILGEMIRFHLTASTLRSVDKAGGLDNYLLTSKYVTEGEGLSVKNRILQKIKQQEHENRMRQSTQKSSEAETA